MFDAPAPATTEPPSPATGWRLGRADAFAALVLVAAIGLSLANRFAFDSWLARFDLYTFFVPWYAYLGDQLRAGDVPGWNPHLFSGTPFAGDPESGWAYLPAMVAFTVLPVLEGFEALAAIHLAIAGAGAYLLARSLKMRAGSSLVVAIAFSTAPLLQWNTYCCLVLNQFAVWMPLLLLGAEMALRASNARRAAPGVVLAAFATSQMFAGWVGQGWLLAPLLLAAWIAARGLPGPAGWPAVRGRFARCVAVGAAILGLGIGLGAAGILPRLDVNLQSNLPVAGYARQGAEGILNPPWTPQHLLAQVMGSSYERRSAAVSGAVLVLAMLAPLLARRRHATPFWTALVLVTTILTLDTTPLHLLAYLIPGFRSLHEHDSWRIYTLAPLGFAMLAGAATEALPRLRGNRRFGLLMVVPLLVIGLAAWWIEPAEGFVGWPPLIAATMTTLVLVAVALAPTKARTNGGKRPTTAMPLATASIVVLVYLQPIGIDLSSSWLGWPAQPSWDRHWNPDPVVASSLRDEISPVDPGGAGEYLQQRLREDGPFRYVGYGGVLYPGANLPPNYMARRFEPGIRSILVNGRPMFLGLYETQGYNPIELERYAAFIEAMNDRRQDYHTAYVLPSGIGSPLLDLLSARFVLLDASLPPDRDDVVALREGRQEVFRTERVVVLERTPAPPHAWVVHEARRAPTDEALALLAAGDVDPYRVALVESDLAQPLAVPSGGESSSARVTRYEADTLSVAVESAAPGLLVLSEAWARGWVATVNGESAPVLPVDGWLRAVPVPEGPSVVELRYEPLSLRAGIVISLVSIVGAAALLAWGARRSPPSP